MPRAAIITPHSLGALEAYRTIIKDISAVLGDPVIDMGELFFALMVQSGLQAFMVPEKHSRELARSPLAEKRIATCDFSRVESVLAELDTVFRHGRRVSLSTEDARALHDVTTFVKELYVAAEFRRPVVTVAPTPEAETVRQLFREDLAAVLEVLIRCIETITVDAPVAKAQVERGDLERFREILDSGAFDMYVESQSSFEALSRSPTTTARYVAQRAHALARQFSSVVALRSTAVRALDVVPQLLELVSGKAFGVAAKPVTTALAGALGREQRLVVYSFYPTWRRIWGGKLDKVRVLLQ